MSLLAGSRLVKDFIRHNPDLTPLPSHLWWPPVLIHSLGGFLLQVKAVGISSVRTICELIRSECRTSDQVTSQTTIVHIITRWSSDQPDYTYILLGTCFFLNTNSNSKQVISLHVLTKFVWTGCLWIGRLSPYGLATNNACVCLQTAFGIKSDVEESNVLLLALCIIPLPQRTCNFIEMRRKIH